MKKNLLLFGLGALLLSACAGKNDETKVNDDSIKLAQLSSDYDEATTFNDSLMLLMGDIYAGLDSINTQEGLLYNMGSGDNSDRRAEIRRNLASIRERLATNRALLADMERRLKASGDESSVQAKTIERLRKHIEEQDARIAKLESDLSAANDNITSLTNEVAETKEQVKVESAAKDEAIAATAAAENEANKVYYAIGSNKELKKNGLLEKKFLGSTKVLRGNFDASYFVTADKRTLRSIPTNSKKVKIWSNMPADSYKITGEKNGVKTIEITNPDKFWSLANHLIIQTD